MIYVTGNEEIFDEWRTLGAHISTLASVAQNDMMVSEEQIQEWVKLTEELNDKFNRLVTETLHHIGYTPLSHLWRDRNG